MLYNWKTLWVGDIFKRGGWTWLLFHPRVLGFLILRMLAALTLYFTWYFDVAAAWLPCWGFPWFIHQWVTNGRVYRTLCTYLPYTIKDFTPLWLMQCNLCIDEHLTILGSLNGWTFCIHLLTLRSHGRAGFSFSCSNWFFFFFSFFNVAM
jgi:hypothetical protein